jgi:Xaa-Pro aminopeptidase
MVLTVEPGLQFQEDDLLVPEELRGTGICIEDDVVVTADGPATLSGSLPCTADDVKGWFAEHRR